MKIKRFIVFLFLMLSTVFMTTGCTEQQISNAVQQIEKPNEITVAHLSDIHIPSVFVEDTVEPTDQEKLLYDAIEQINEDKNVDFTLITGDIVNEPNTELFLHITQIFNELKKPWYFALGNHDRNWPFSIEREPLLQILHRVNPKMPEGRYYEFSPKQGFKFIALDGSDYGIDEEQIEYLRNQIDETPAEDLIVIFMHTPVLPPVDFIDHHAENEEIVVELLKSYKRPFVIFAGHYHATKLTLDDNILHISSPSLRYAQEFRIVNIKNEKDKVILNFDYKETNLKDLITDPKERYAGEEEDKFATIELAK